ncbi:MAG: hypothetical protein CV089_10070 [Nitrospira sp. WS110]|nr:hypothetical protein [Nitrospira sp. WS110]
MIDVLMGIVGTSGGPQERRFGDRRKSDGKEVGVSDANLVSLERIKRDRVSVSTEDHREEGRRRRKLLVWDQEGNCHEGKTPCLRNTTVFVESTRLMPIGSDVTLSLVPGEEDAVGRELAQGKVVWHCPQADEFGNEAGFGVLFQRQWPQAPGTGTVSGTKGGV